MDVRAELVGTVSKILVKAGDAVEEDQELIILESMKMEIPVVAPHAGTVDDVKVKENDVVAESQVLVVLS
ncbi:MAG TPA: biotin/lipoyl-binding carrier protein [Candidatus Dormibacteraeota bacterium]